jgi:hypothetical protein
MPMFIRQIALTTESEDIEVGLDELMRVSAALQKQATRDFAPIWEVSATVDAFARLEDVPLGYWRIVLVKDIPDAPDAAGIHQDKDGQPFALVIAGSSWPLTASHECLEMLADPFGNRLIAGQSPKPGQGRVEFLVEVCDPSEEEAFAYTVNNTLVSDFYTPRYFDPQAAPGVQYSFTGAITEPRQVLRGGYLSWHDPVSDRWFQEQFFDPKRKFVDLGRLARDGQSLRSMIDAKTPQSRKLSHLSPEAPIMALTARGRAQGDESSAAKARSLRSQIEALRSK